MTGIKSSRVPPPFERYYEGFVNTPPPPPCKHFSGLHFDLESASENNAKNHKLLLLAFEGVP
jgi:hypothetical protein